MADQNYNLFKNNALGNFASAATSLSGRPLGIIALFLLFVYAIAGLVLTVGAASLEPFERRLLVWFLMLFPILVLIIFVWLVRWHHEKMYAPSDFLDSEGFLRAMTADEQRARLRAEVIQMQLDARKALSLSEVHSNDAKYESLQSQSSEREAGEVVQSESSMPEADDVVHAQTLSAPSAHEFQEAASNDVDTDARIEEYAIAEDLVFNELGMQMKLPVRRNVAIGSDEGLPIDGLLISTEGPIFVDVKMFLSSSWSAGVESALRHLSMVQELYTGNSRFVLAIVHRGIQETAVNEQIQVTRQLLNDCEFAIELHVFEYGDLQRKYHGIWHD